MFNSQTDSTQGGQQPQKRHSYIGRILDERNDRAIPVSVAPLKRPIHFRVRDEFRFSHSAYAF